MPSQPAAYPVSCEAPTATTPSSPRHDRSDVASKLLEFDAALDRGSSQRAAAEEAGVPRSTLRYWSARRSDLDVPGPVAAFLETPAGLAWLHRLVMAAVFVMTLRGPEGIRLVCEFLELSGLAEVVGASFGSIQKLTLEMQEQIAAFGTEQREVLGQNMPEKPITVCEDETFHPKPCVVAIEPASNFILLEHYVERRDAQTWNMALDLALEGLPVRVIQSTSDQGQALLRHTRDLDAHHSPDLFHPQHDLGKATALPLARRLRQATEAHEKAVRTRERLIANRDAYQTKRHGPGRPPDFAGRIERAQQAVEESQQAIDEALADQKACREAISGLSADYHCYRLSDGLAQPAEKVEALIASRFAVIDEVAERADLSQNCLAKIDKARRVTADMVATISFVHTEIAVRLACLDISPELRMEMALRWVPGLYLMRVAARAKLAEDRRALIRTAEALLAPLRAPEHPLRQLDSEAEEQLGAVATTCAELFQRSSSCVEGRNGQLALFHHGLHRLTDKKLAALTVIHNFHTRRPDGTTPAERFFDTEHRDLFSALLERMPQLARPAKPRSKRPYRAPRRLAA